MKKIKTFNELNELRGTTYSSVMNKVADKRDPKSFRLYDDARKLRSEYYSKEPLKLRIGFSENDIEFKIYDISLRNDVLRLTSIIDNKEHELIFGLEKKVLIYTDSHSIEVFTNRKGANIISKILKEEYNIEIKPQEIPQF
jgi:hypothetical protein